jgi:HlyD family secretion protein
MTRSRIRWAVTIGIALVAVAMLADLLWPRAFDVDAAAVRRGRISDVVVDQGVARVRQSYVVSAPVSGRLERVPLEVGDRVVANVTAVAIIRPVAPEFLDARSRAQAAAAVQGARTALDSAIAQRDRLAAQRNRANEQLRRATDLVHERVVSQQEFDDAKTDAQAAGDALRAAEADIATRRANLASAQLALASPASGRGELVTVRSPSPGVVTRLVQQSERTVVAGTPLVEIGDTSGLEAAIEFLTQDAVKISPGLRAEIFNWGGPADIPAEVRLVEPQGFTKVSALGVEEQRTLVILRIPDGSACAGLAPGYRVWGRVHLRDVSDAVLAPVGGLVRNNGAWAVYRLEHGRARLRAVTVGTMTDADAEMTSGVDVGDRLILYPSDRVTDGIRVRAR